MLGCIYPPFAVTPAPKLLKCAMRTSSPSVDAFFNAPQQCLTRCFCSWNGASFQKSFHILLRSGSRKKETRQEMNPILHQSAGFQAFPPGQK